MMRIFNKTVLLLSGFALIVFMSGCEEEDPLNGFNGTILSQDYGILEVDFELPEFQLIQSGIKRVDLALCYTMDSMYRGEFFYRSNVSDAKQIYQIQLPQGRYYYQVVITCICGGDSCIFGGFPYGYGGLKYAFDEVNIKNGEKTFSKPTFQ